MILLLRPELWIWRGVLRHIRLHMVVIKAILTAKRDSPSPQCKPLKNLSLSNPTTIPTQKTIKKSSTTKPLMQLRPSSMSMPKMVRRAKAGSMRMKLLAVMTTTKRRLFQAMRK